MQLEFADLLEVDRSTASSTIEKLRQAGFIEKVVNKDNRKNAMLYASEKGLNVFTMLKREEEYTEF